VRLVAYLRTSTNGNGNGDSLDAQEDACRTWAAEHGHEIVGVFRDEGISGKLDAPERPGLADALELLEAGEAEGLVVHRLDRLARELHVQEAVLGRVWGADGRAFEAVEGEIPRDDPDDPYRTFVRQVMGAAAQLERSMIAARLRGGRKRERERGGYAGGFKRHGYRVDEEGRLTPEKETVEIIQQVFTAREGRTLEQTAEELNRLRVPTLSGTGRWHPTAVRRIIERAKREST